MPDYIFKTYILGGREYFVYGERYAPFEQTNVVKEKDFPFLESLLELLYLDIWIKVQGKRSGKFKGAPGVILIAEKSRHPLLDRISTGINIQNPLKNTFDLPLHLMNC